MIWQEWWVWAVIAIGLGILEMVVPGFIFLGFAVGAAFLSGLLLLGLGPSLPVSALLFAVASLAAWIVARKVFGLKRGSVKTFDHDIND